MMETAIDAAMELVDETGDYRGLAMWAEDVHTRVQAAWSQDPYRRDLPAAADRLDLIRCVAATIDEL